MVGIDIGYKCKAIIITNDYSFIKILYKRNMIMTRVVYQ